MTFLNADTKIATHAAITTNVHGTGAGNVIVGDDELASFISGTLGNKDSIATLDGNGRLIHGIKKVTSNNARHAENGSIDRTNTGSYVTYKRFTFPHGIRGTVNLRTTHWIVPAGDSAYMRWYVDGSPVGTERIVSAEAATTHDENVVVDVGNNGVIEMRGYCTGSTWRGTVCEIRYDNEGAVTVNDCDSSIHP